MIASYLSPLLLETLPENGRSLGAQVNPRDQHAFALGCLKTAMHAGVQSRKGLSYLARGVGAASLCLMSVFAIIVWTIKANTAADNVAFANMVTWLCLFYMGGAGLLVFSLRGLKIYAAFGGLLAALSWLYCHIEQPHYGPVSADILTALSLEAGGIMAGLFTIAFYLGWLYQPDIHES